VTNTRSQDDRLDVYRLAVEYTAESFRAAQGLSGLHRHARDQWLRAAQSIPLNIAEGNGFRSCRTSRQGAAPAAPSSRCGGGG
jgi:four helix bundle protein